MRLSRPLATLRYVLIIPFALASLMSAPAFAETEILIRQAPPPMRAEMMPRERPGYVWDRGHWRWAGNHYEWIPGHWQPAMRGGHWIPGHWAQRGPNWRWVEGHWAR